MEVKLILAGLGGQGVIFLTRLLAQTAVALNHPVMVSETHGMSQRGGSVTSHLKIGGNQAPLIQRGTADILLALELTEALRNLPYLRRGGTAIVNAEDGFPSKVESHLTRLDIQVLTIPASRLAVELGSAAVANVVLTGFTIATPVLPFPLENVREIITNLVPRGRELNLRALEKGYQVGNLGPNPNT